MSTVRYPTRKLNVLMFCDNVNAVNCSASYFFLFPLSVLAAMRIPCLSPRVYNLNTACMSPGKRRYNIKLWKTFTDCFNCLPIAAIGRTRGATGSVSPYCAYCPPALNIPVVLRFIKKLYYNCSGRIFVFSASTTACGCHQ